MTTQASEQYASSRGLSFSYESTDPESSGGPAPRRARRESRPDLVNLGQAARATQLACEGALSLLFRTSLRDVLDRLVVAGIEWEDEFTRVPARRERQRSPGG
jgi:hypothetical protein